RARFTRVDRLVAVGIGERLGDVRRQGRLAGRLAVEPHAPSALAEVLEQLHLALTLALLQPPRRPGPRFPDAVAECLQEKHFARPPLDWDPRGNDARVVDDNERVPDLPCKVGEFTVPGTVKTAVPDQQAGLVAPRGWILGDQLRRKVVVQLG